MVNTAEIKVSKGPNGKSVCERREMRRDKADAGKH